MKLDSPHLRRSLRADDRRSRPPGRHRPASSASSATSTTYGDEAKFGGGKVIRDGMGQSPTATRAGGAPDLVITIGADRRQHAASTRPTSASATAASRRSARRAIPGIMDGVTPGLEIGASTEILAGEGHILTAGGIDAHVHFISPNQIPDAFHSGITTLIGGGTGPATGTNATTCTPGAWNIRRMYEAVQAFPLNFGFLGKGNASTPEPLREQIRAGAHRPEAARGLGHDAGRDRSLPVGRRRVRRAGGDSHRHAERGRIRRGHDRRDRRPDDSHLSHRRRRRRPRARHHPALRRAERAPVVDQPDDAVHAEHAGRASRHADGVPSPVAEGARGRRVRRLAHPAGDDRRRGRAARSRRDQHDVVRLAGDGTDRRSDLPHLADRRQDEAAARRRCRRDRPATTTCASGATSRNTRSTRRSRTASRATSARSRSASSPISCCGSRRSSASSPS